MTIQFLINIVTRLLSSKNPSRIRFHHGSNSVPYDSCEGSDLYCLPGAPFYYIRMSIVSFIVTLCSVHSFT